MTTGDNDGDLLASVRVNAMKELPHYRPADFKEP